MLLSALFNFFGLVIQGNNINALEEYRHVYSLISIITTLKLRLFF